MKYALILLLGMASRLSAGEALLTRSYQPLDGLESGKTEVSPVVCVDWYGTSGYPNAIVFITHPNSPISNAPEPVGDLNLASRYGLEFKVVADAEQQFIAILDCTSLKITGNDELGEATLVGATLECLRRTMGDKIGSILIEIRLKPEGQEELRKVFDAFMAHPKAKPFPWKPKEP